MPEGSKPIEAVVEGDIVWTRDENDPEGPAVARRVRQTFVGVSDVLTVVVEGRLIGTTAERPFRVEDRGWVEAAFLRVGDILIGRTGHRLPVSGIVKSGRVATVCNFEVEDYHSYFVGCDEWGWSVWTHNYDVSEGAPPMPESMSESNGRTVGILSWTANGKSYWVKLVSEERNAKDAGLNHTVSGDNAANYHHVEAQARKAMIDKGITDADLVINNSKGVCDFCSPRSHPHLLGDALPKNSSLQVFLFSRARLTFLRSIEGTGFNN